MTTGEMRGGEIVYLGWSDYVGITRCRGVPAKDYERRRAYGLGWAVAGQALTPFEDIAPNPWGPMLEVRQTPVEATRTRLDLWPDAPPFHLVLCDSLVADGSNWDCCTRGFMKRALEELERVAGAQLAAAFEHEFRLTREDHQTTVPFSLESMRQVAGFAGDMARALETAGLEPETVEPEFGICQYEVTCAPTVGATAGDRAILTREVIREAARRLGYRASFSPKPAPESVGNGAHVHFSFVDGAGRNLAYDPNQPNGASLLAQRFIAGLVCYLPAITALLAPSPVSYMRLGPHHWSCGYASFGVQNREAAVRICPSPERDPAKRGRVFNLELRVPDGTASPYLVIGALVRAGLEGLRQELPLPPALDRDPADLSDEERRQLGVVPLPATLEEALQALEAEPAVKSWMAPVMLESYVAVKRKEIAMFAEATPAELCRRYHDAY